MCTEIEIDGNLYPITFHIVSESLFKYDVIVGAGFLNNVEVNIRGKELVISQLEDRVRNSAQIPDVFKIDAIQNSDEVDLSHIRDAENRDARC